MAPERNSPAYYVGVDVGGTNIKVGVVDNDGHALSKVSVPTNAKQGPKSGLDTICRCIDRAIAESSLSINDIVAIGVATPGTMDIPAGMILEPPNLPGWVNIPIRQLVSDRYGKPAILQNDANAAAYGEYWVGRGRDAHSMVFWTLGTGIGCGIIVADMIIQGEHSHGSECGHIIIEMDHGRLCGTGQYGTLEAYASATALVQRFREAIAAGRDSTLRETVSKDGELTALIIAQAAVAGDRLADELIMENARCLGIGTTSLMHTIDPNMVLLGGAMTFGRNDTKLGRRFLQRVRDEVKLRAFPVPAAKTIIDYATLGNDAGFIGAAGCARREFGAKR